MADSRSNAVGQAGPRGSQPPELPPPSTRYFVFAMVLLVVGFVVLQVHAARLQVQLHEFHHQASIERIHIELGTQIRRGCRLLYVGLLEHWHGRSYAHWQQLEAEVADKSRALASTPATDDEDEQGRAQLLRAANEWVTRLRDVIERGEGPQVLEEMRARQALVDQWSDKVIDADVRAGARFDGLHRAVQGQWTAVEAVAAILLVLIAIVAMWWRARVRARTTDLEQRRREGERAARSEFFTNMSHELRTPLVSIGGFASMVEDNPSTNEDVRGYARKILHVSRELLAIINNILDVAKLESDHMKFFIEPVAITEVLERCIARAEGLIGHKPLKLTLDVQPDVPRVRGDFVKLQQVFTNIVGNAVKFTEKGEVITSVRPAGKNVVIEVQDTGIGIEPQSLQSIWEPFRQVDHKVSRKFGGSGLGLAIVHAVVTRLGGTVSAESTVGVGTMFRVTLPADFSKAPPTPSSKKSLSQF
ncbi:HAMP domain-containing histidine kinase [Pendulispora rubella]|uniref:histidine kinase n=1 Tax=Pendulispora rubella TaxID=2741070 RepID=A0ABZ2KR89_9BACT